MRHVVFADPANAEARALGADAFEQLGYLAESATWRNAYLLGAQELRQGPPTARPSSLDREMVQAMTVASVFDVLGTHVNAPKAWARDVIVNWTFTDTREQIAVTLRHGAVTHVTGKRAANAAATVSLTRAAFNELVLGRQTLPAAQAAGTVTVTGDSTAAAMLFEVLDRFDAGFPIVEPRRPR
jgi:alkyl sulfatase BDS1-like metallo-beta-lactamase superfamily hydrolase